MIAGRYRVEKRAWDAGTGPVWLARDEVLERAVLIQTFPRDAAEGVARAVARAAQITHPALSQIYDVSDDPLGLVFENAPGGRLADRKEAALPPPQAAVACRRLGTAIAALHSHGVAHGAIGPATVLFDEEGRAKLAGAALAGEVGDGVLAPPAAYLPPEPDATPEERDRYGLAAVAYRLFTGRDPGPDAPPARAVRRDVPVSVDELLSRALGREPAARPSIEELQRVVSPLADVEPAERGPGFFRQEARWLVPVLLIVGLAGAAIAVGVRKIQTGGEPKPSPTATVASIKVASVRDFDPPPGNGSEHPEQARFVIDGTDKGWLTLGYKTANMAPKKGVGLLFDLGASRRVARIEVKTSLPGWKAEWRTAASEGPTAADYRIVATFTADGKIFAFPTPAEGRWWLLWITTLTDNGSGSDIPWQAQVSEVTFLPR